jgi:hypothetical protein
VAWLRSGDGPLSVRARPSSIKRDCDRRATSTGEKRLVYVHAKSRLTPEPLRALRSETKGQAGACPDRTRAIPCTVQAVTGPNSRTSRAWASSEASGERDVRSTCDSERPTTVTHGQSWSLNSCRHQRARQAFALVRALETSPQLVVRGGVEPPTFRFSGWWTAHTRRAHPPGSVFPHAPNGPRPPDPAPSSTWPTHTRHRRRGGRKTGAKRATSRRRKGRRTDADAWRRSGPAAPAAPIGKESGQGDTGRQLLRRARPPVRHHEQVTGRRGSRLHRLACEYAAPSVDNGRPATWCCNNYPLFHSYARPQLRGG